MDSTSLPVCRLHKARSHNLFKNIAKFSKSSFGFYYGFKFHLIADVDGVPLSFSVNTFEERKWLEIELNSTFKDWNFLFVGDKGYQSKGLQNIAYQSGNYLLTGVKKSKKQTLPLAFWQLQTLKLRARIETCFEKLKNNFNLACTKRRSKLGFIFNILLAVFGLLIR